jgi:hypothetical protein
MGIIIIFFFFLIICCCFIYKVAGQEVDWTDSDMIAGLNLIDNMSIFPHHSNRFAHLVQTKSKEMDHKVIPLKDEEGLIFIDNEYRILTA